MRLSRKEDVRCLDDMARQVVIVLTCDAGPRFAALAQSSNIWVARTADTERWADEIRAAASGSAEASRPSITLYNGTGDGVADLAWLLDEVELHHGLASSKDSPVTAIRIVGLELTPAVRSMLASRNFSDFTCDQGDILARWAPPR